MCYQICTRCVMDNKSDETIIFDNSGVCNYCKSALVALSNSAYFDRVQTEIKLRRLLEEIKNHGEGRDFDCIMGLSGGLDSSYLLFLGYKWGLRILAIHIDDGYDTDVTKENVRRLLQAIQPSSRIETIYPDKEQYNFLTKAFLVAGVPNAAIPQDNIIFSSMRKMARHYNLNYFLSGANLATESILQIDRTYSYDDLSHIHSIHRQFGERPIDKLDMLSSANIAAYGHVLNYKTYAPLNLVDYNKENALKELSDFCGYKNYGAKHHENILTRFIQCYYFPQKFDVDKRASHLSSLIMSGQISRDFAIKELGKKLYPDGIRKSDTDIVLRNFNMSESELDKIMNERAHRHSDYAVSQNHSVLHGDFFLKADKFRGINFAPQSAFNGTYRTFLDMVMESVRSSACEDFISRCRDRIFKLLNIRKKSINGSYVILFGRDDDKELTIPLMRELSKYGAITTIVDNDIAVELIETTDYLVLRQAQTKQLDGADIVVMARGNPDFDYDLIQRNSRLILDIGDNMSNVPNRANIEVMVMPGGSDE